MEEGYDIQRLLVLRKLTVAISRLLTEQMREYMATLAPLLRPSAVLGGYLQSSTKETLRAGAEQAFKELQALYEKVAGSRPFNLQTELKPPIEILSAAIEFTPLEYTHVAQAGDESKTIIITSPLKWALSYAGFSLGRLEELAADRHRSGTALKEFLLHYLVMHVVVSKQTGVTQMMDTLHFPFSTHTSPKLGEMPITYVTSSLSTVRPPDHVLIESTEISGRNVFEEVINLEDITKLRDPLKERLIELVRSQGEDLLPQE